MVDYCARNGKSVADAYSLPRDKDGKDHFSTLYGYFEYK